MANLMLSVAKATQTKDKKFILKLQHKSSKQMQTPFGMKTVEHQETYYMKTDTSPGIGFSAELDPNTFIIKERDYLVEDPNSDMNGQTIQLKWLHLK